MFSGSLLRPTVGITGVVTAAAFETIAVSTAMPEAVKAVNGLGAYAWAFNGVVIATLGATVAGGDYSDRKGFHDRVPAGPCGDQERRR